MWALHVGRASCCLRPEQATLRAIIVTPSARATAPTGLGESSSGHSRGLEAGAQALEAALQGTSAHLAMFNRMREAVEQGIMQKQDEIDKVTGARAGLQGQHRQVGPRNMGTDQCDL